MQIHRFAFYSPMPSFHFLVISDTPLSVHMVMCRQTDGPTEGRMLPNRLSPSMWLVKIMYSNNLIKYITGLPRSMPNADQCG